MKRLRIALTAAVVVIVGLLITRAPVPVVFGAAVVIACGWCWLLERF